MGNIVAVVDYGMGNLRSVAKALEQAGPQWQVKVTDQPADIDAAARIVVPGQGAMPDCMHELQARQLDRAISRAAREKPLLGICVGLQMLFGEAEEGPAHGLDILPGRVPKFPVERMLSSDGHRLKVPHMGWNQVHQETAHPLWQNIQQDAHFYFVHSYYVAPDDAGLSAATTDYGLRFTSAVARDNIFAVQFHPEKSARDGLQLLNNFLHWQP